ncbi:MAG: ATP-binding protein [Methanosarcinales archaeon]|nr:ATP-binding protein [Methanosarcinales archaeon]
MTIKSEFINRKDELKYLEEEYNKQDFRFISVVGRRRLGKTRLIQEFITNRSNYNYFLVPELNDMDTRLELSGKFHESFGLSFIGTPSWNEIFEKLFVHSLNRQMIVIFDEFQGFLNINKGIFSLLQEFIDRYAKDSGMFLIVSGSSIGMMHKIFDHASPLYGRRTGQLYFQPFNFFALKEWFPSFPTNRLVEIYAIYGGTPKYLEDVESRDGRKIEATNRGWIEIRNRLLLRRSGLNCLFILWFNLPLNPRLRHPPPAHTHPLAFLHT